MTFYATDGQGNYIKIGDRIEVVTIKDPNEPPDPLKGICIAVQREFGFEFELGRKDKRIWSKIMMMPQYKATEWMFPRKKKRGTMRRKRKEE